MKIPFRNVIAYIYSLYLIYFGKLKSLKDKCNRSEIILSVYFHNPSKELFKKCIDWFLKNKFQFISTEDLRKIIVDHSDFPKSAVVITIDDGWKENNENVFLLAKKYNIPITLFATTEPIETNGKFWWTIIANSRKNIIQNKKIEALKIVPNEVRLKQLQSANQISKMECDTITKDELIELSKTKHINIGSHTITHPILTMCKDNVSEFEISESKKILEGWLHHTVTQFAYPNGDYSERECAFLNKSGYNIAFTTHPKYIHKVNSIDVFQIPRFGVVDNIPFTENLCRMTGIWYERKNYNK